MNDKTAAGEVQLEPWILLSQENPACWRLEDGREAIALFSSEDAARRYAIAAELDASDCIQPPPTALVRILVQCVEADISTGVLDPQGSTARRVFDLREVLRRVREDLRDGRPLAF